MPRHALFVAMLATWFASSAPIATLAAPPVTLNEADFRDRVFACWMGKNIGGTLGMPVEGKQEINHIEFYTNLKPGEPAPNDDLDLQILWLKAMEEHDAQVDARILGEYWLKFVPVDWNEYGVGMKNMRRGFLPPLCGQFDNAQWRPSNGAWIRSEIWASLAPGNPALAARFAREDACVDHGADEGTLAELFTAAVESAAFVERDRDKLIEIGLSMLPPDSKTAKAIHTVLEAKRAGRNWEEARGDVVEATKDTGWFQSPRNVAFVVIGWVYGENDFVKSVCITVNCGDDTDSTGATIGSLMGILLGSKGIPAKWTEPIGDTFKTVAISGFAPPKDLGEFTDRTVAMTKKVAVRYGNPVVLTDGPTDLSRVGELRLIDGAAARRLWAMSPWQVVWHEADARIELDYLGEPWIARVAPRRLALTLTNEATKTKTFVVELEGVPAEWKAEGLVRGGVVLASGESRTLELTFRANDPEAGDNRMMVKVDYEGAVARIPLTLVGREGVAAANLALVSKGAVATADSELAREPSPPSRVIDGKLGGPGDSSANRWHSSIDAPHPHWVQVKLAKPELIGGVVIHFADPDGYPVKFDGLVIPEGKTNFTPAFRVEDNKRSKNFRTKIEPVRTDTFRLLIHSSANVKYPNAAQISEIELLPPEK